MNVSDFEETLLSTRSYARERVLAFVIAVVVLLAVGFAVARYAVGGTSSGAAPTAVRASATGVSVLVPGKAPRSIAAAQPVAGTRTEQVASAAQYAFPADGSIVRVGRVWSRAVANDRTLAATSRVDVGNVELLGGRIVVRGLSLRATAAVAKQRATGSFTLAPGATLVVDGVEQQIATNHQVVLKGLGSLSVNEQAVVASAPRGDRQTGPRHRVVGAAVHLRLSRKVEGLPAGSEIVVGRVEAGVRQGKVQQVAHGPAGVVPQPATPAALQSAPAGAPRLQPGSPKPGVVSIPRRSTSVRATAPAPAGALQGYVFPVLGQSNYSNDYGAPRASTGIPHQGNDIFAAEGTPLVAVADGVLDRVGWNSIGGYRFWLFDRHGNSFYYAHLSAFSPLAVDGAAVRAGDVIGFVGHTGDAQYTPPHVHFEVHPGNGSPTNPFPFLNAWKRGVARAISALPGDDGTGRRAGLTLLEVADISPNSGLGGDGILSEAHSTAPRPVTEETKPKPTDETLAAAINGPAINAG